MKDPLAIMRSCVCVTSTAAVTVVNTLPTLSGDKHGWSGVTSLQIFFVVAGMICLLSTFHFKIKVRELKIDSEP